MLISIYRTSEWCFSRALIGSLSRNILFLARMTAHDIDNMVSRFPEAQTSEIDEKAIPINRKKATKFGLNVFQGKVLFLNIILRVNFTREAKYVMPTRNNCQLPGLFTNSKYGYKDCIFLLH